MAYDLDHYVQRLVALRAKSKDESEFYLRVANAMKITDDTLNHVNQLRSEEAERAAIVKRELLKRMEIII